MLVDFFRHIAGDTADEWAEHYGLVILLRSPTFIVVVTLIKPGFSGKLQLRMKHHVRKVIIPPPTESL